jgi:CheY-like chemotaxis protein/signal transduction histidine kinase
MRVLIGLLTLFCLHAGCLADIQALSGLPSQPVQTYALLEAAPPATRVLESRWQQQFSPVHDGRRLPADLSVWLRLNVQQPSSEPVIWWLDPWPMMLSYIQAYRQTGDNLVPIGVQHSHGPMALMLPPGNSTLYVQLHSALQQPLALHWRADQQAGRMLSVRNTLASAAFGALGLLLLVTLGLMSLYRDRAYGLLTALIGGHLIWLYSIWAGAGASQIPLAIHGLYASAAAGILLMRALQSRDPILSAPHLLLLAATLLGCLSAWLLSAHDAASPALALWLAGLGSAVMLGLHASMTGSRSTLEIAALLSLPLVIALSLSLSSDNGLQALLAPMPGLLACILISDVGILVCLIRRTKHRWLDHEARQRLLNTVESITRSRGDILGRISHEIRTPMSGILGMAELLQETPMTAEQQEYVETIRNSGYSLLNLIGEVLDESTLALEGSVANEALFEPEPLIIEVVNGFYNLAEQRHTELICDLNDPLPAVLIGDPVRLRQVLLHTLGHAIRASANGEVTLQTQCRIHEQRARMLFRIHHEGPGMTPHAISHALGQHLNGASSTPQTASAGLSVARRLVQMMHGEFGIENKPEQGTTVHFSLDFPVERISSPHTTLNDRALDNQRLLIVDDSDSLLRTLSHQAERWGMTVESARTGSEALGKARNRMAMGQAYDVILLDHQLPGMTGIELARRLRQIQEPPPAMLMLTGLRHLPGLAEYQSAGIRRLLTKPATGTALKTALIEVLDEQHRDDTLPAEPVSHPLAVLLAEDNPVTARVIEAMLKKLGATCTRVSNGQQAVDACQTHHFDLLLMDCDMPVMDGYAATRAIREWEQASNSPPMKIYALTAHILDEYREQSRRAGMNGHLGKPVALPQLANVLETCLQSG